MGDETMIALAKFFTAAFEHMLEGYDWDGCDMQAAMRQSGLTYERLYDPATDEDIDACEGDMIFVLTETGKAVRALARPTHDR
jgi:hypothetical protein